MTCVQSSIWPPGSSLGSDGQPGGTSGLVCYLWAIVGASAVMG